MSTPVKQKTRISLEDKVKMETITKQEYFEPSMDDLIKEEKENIKTETKVYIKSTLKQEYFEPSFDNLIKEEK